MKQELRNTLIRLLGTTRRFFPYPRPKIRVIALHDIPHAHEEMFEEKMRWLSTHCHIVSLDDVAKRRNLDEMRPNVALTFDDGFKEYVTFVTPTLKRMNLPATFFIPSGALGLTGNDAARFSKEGLRRSSVFQFMTEEELNNIAKEPLFDIGGHTMHHKDVAALDEAGREMEIAEDKRAIERIIGRPTKWFAYPFGGVANINVPAIEKIAASGYTEAFSILPSFWRATDHRYLIGRDSMSVADSIPLWNAWLSGGYDAMIAMKNGGRLKTLADELRTRGI